MTLLQVENLSVSFSTPEGSVKAVSGLSYSVEKGATLGIVGESGSGKSQSVFAILGLLASNAHVSGSIRFNGRELIGLSEQELNRIRSKEIGIIFQDPMTSLNPFMRVSDQLSEVLMHHKGMSKKDALNEAIRMLDAVRIPQARERVNMYPHEFSGGMRQRVMIAMSLLCNPQMLIADEPTTALDVTVQAQIMHLLKELQRELSISIVLITHDLGIVAGACDHTMIMYGGRMMEYGSTLDIFKTPSHPYTQGLLKAIPRPDDEGDELYSIPGNPPNLLNPPTGCPFAERCCDAGEQCEARAPALEALSGSRLRACHKPWTPPVRKEPPAAGARLELEAGVRGDVL
ncbi:ATP-binding cassette domain-containing protein [Hahella aquimaris]|uniref:oligopeptide/dipeptide ABC transporter ATP-binding protein n=1 Tax=Hahella sp. HNIBRBA332 TaxID=3015983 RepID=UPI00273C40DD|nr:oligopeptide/dipeptide ABC transporter ATP-binding protein [Hahella sp. HNIBRBA332]WLQ12144.1 ATP-binding cassette domain-containing protein [Hahella sp. HNIBRBA332]